MMRLLSKEERTHISLQLARCWNTYYDVIAEGTLNRVHALQVKEVDRFSCPDDLLQASIKTGFPAKWVESATVVIGMTQKSDPFTYLRQRLSNYFVDAVSEGFVFYHVDCNDFVRLMFDFKYRLRSWTGVLMMRHVRRVCAGMVLARGCHDWIWKPKCRDGTIGVVPRVSMRILFSGQEYETQRQPTVQTCSQENHPRHADSVCPPEKPTKEPKKEPRETLKEIREKVPKEESGC